MTETTYQDPTQKTWNVLFEDSKYKSLLNKVDELLEETQLLYFRKYRVDYIDETQKPKVEALEQEFRAYATNRLADIETRVEQFEKNAETTKVDNPEAELLRRQDFEARISFYNDQEIMDYINNADVQNMSVYELNILKDAYDKKLSEDQQNKVAYAMENLKQGVLYPYTTDEEYNNLTFAYNVIDQTGMANSGVVITPDNEYGGVIIKTLSERYNDALTQAKNKQDSARQQAEFNKQYVYKK
ncbi:hypothetical protein [Staphylococcus simiae]|uniref:Uncharacterized protein n=1 Tax=Staphylococcus simiae CCM 7213 = CCUG 51256 TaxID=911238 RepID=G5JFY9_9STAP|nr:hypothetical protein [Staphylococcus simiae]EHJ08879.1 hypothetical protein SS7213T_01768 [Staphylococcus simiae CCM 7213 = CCUG 51256]PNZ10952.1 hypothetical protein CD113_09220 [Staphylococcus simiae]SNV60686.1 Uncharacterised protein [Staphylococcus simiae]